MEISYRKPFSPVATGETVATQAASKAAHESSRHTWNPIKGTMGIRC